MSYKVKMLGDNLYQVSLPWWCCSNKPLIAALLELQAKGKLVSYIQPLWGLGSTYLVGTLDK